MPLLVHAVLAALGVHGAAIEHARLTDRQIGHVDHLLHLAQPLGDDFAVFERHQFGQLALVLPQLIADLAHQIPALRRGHVGPGARRADRLAHDGVVAGRAGGWHAVMAGVDPAAVQDVVRQRQGIAEAEVSSAVELSAAQKTELAKTLSRLTGKKIEPKYSLDPAILGGAIARVGDTIYDGSLRSRLAEMRTRLSQE